VKKDCLLFLILIQLKMTFQLSQTPCPKTVVWHHYLDCLILVVLIFLLYLEFLMMAKVIFPLFLDFPMMAKVIFHLFLDFLMLVATTYPLYLACPGKIAVEVCLLYLVQILPIVDYLLFQHSLNKVSLIFNKILKIHGGCNAQIFKTWLSFINHKVLYIICEFSGISFYKFNLKHFHVSY
jgi:hypothetical protein